MVESFHQTILLTATHAYSQHTNYPQTTHLQTKSCPLSTHSLLNAGSNAPFKPLAMTPTRTCRNSLPIPNRLISFRCGRRAPRSRPRIAPAASMSAVYATPAYGTTHSAHSVLARRTTANPSVPFIRRNPTKMTVLFAMV